MNNPTILIVDDEPANLAVLSQLLGPTYRVRACKSGQQALEASRGEPRPDLILLDVMMPGMDGYTVLAKLKEDEQTRDIPVIFVSGMADDLDEEKGLRLGAVDYLTKPIKPAVVLARVAAHVAIKQTLDRLAQELAERKKAEDALRSASLYTRSLIEASVDPMCVISPEGKLTDVNRATEEALGLSRERLIGNDFVDYLVDQEDVQEAFHKVLEEGLVKDHPVALRHTSGRAIECLAHATVYRNESGEVQGVFAAARDITERKRAEEALRKSELWLKSIFNSIESSILVVTPERMLVDVNAATQSIFGYSPRELRELSTEVLHVDHEHYLEFGRRINDAFEKGETAHFDFEAKRKNGQIFPTEHIVSLLKDDNGEAIGIVSVVRDITRRKQAEDALRENEEKYRRLFENQLMAIALFDPETLRFIDVNDTHVRLYGYSREELMSGMTATDLTADRKASLQSIQHAKSTGTVWVPLRYHKKKDGTVFPVEVAAGLHMLKGRQVMFAIAKDISKRVQLEKALQESVQFYHQLADNLNVGFFETDSEGLLTFANDALAKIHGFDSCNEVIGRPILSLIESSARERVSQLFAEALSTGNAPEIIEIPMLRIDGSVVQTEVKPTMIFQPDGSLKSVGLLVDISQRKRDEDNRRQMERHLHQVRKAESLNRMAGAIAHHFNNLLGAVMGNLELAMDGLPREGIAYETLTAAMRASRRAAEVSTLMLTYLGQVVAQKEPMDLADVCRRSIPKLEAAVPEGVALEVDLPSPGPAIKANADRVGQIIHNLVINACEAFGENSGTVYLAVRTVSCKEIPDAHRLPLGWQPEEKDYACLEVKDSGCGIAEGNIDQLFDPFFSTKFTGRGLGLPVVLGIVRAHGGAVTVASEPGQGSMFRVFFPLSAQPAPLQAEKAESPAKMVFGGTILLVEDEAQVRKMAVRMLTRLGFTVIEAKDGAEAVEVFRQRQGEIRMVLCDLSMPRLTGWETITALRELDPAIRVILASGYDEARVMQGEHPEKPQVFLHKPYSMADLQTAVTAALQSN